MTIREDVPAAVLCRAGQLIPRAFWWGGAWLPVTAILRTWQGHHRGDTLHYWLVEAGGRTFKACYHSGQVAWMVEELPS